MDKDKVLDEILNSDPLGLLEVKPKSSSSLNTDERLVTSFQEINEFVESYNREPQPNEENISEYKLYHRLKNLKGDKDKMMVCKPYDKYGLLKKEIKEIKSIDDIFDDDSLNILDSCSEGLFCFKHTPKVTTMPDYVGSRKPCEHFEEFESLFMQCQYDLAHRSGNHIHSKTSKILLKVISLY